MRKVEKAMAIDGPTYIHLHAPCLVGWGVAENLGVTIARLAVETCFFPLYEVSAGRQFRLTKQVKKKKPVEEYLKPQGRFKHLSPESIEGIQGEVDARWEYLQKLCGM